MAKGVGSRLIAEACPLCFSAQNTLFHRDRQRDFFRCSQCALVFVPPCSHLSKSDEKGYYDLHQNSPHDLGYRAFLERLSKPLIQALEPASRGLDFGCGPGPTLSLMLQEQGHSVDLYDPFYAPDKSVFSRQYDFVTSTEVLEHLRAPGHELNRLWALLRPGGVLALMTKRVIDKTAFARWHYKNDPTHIVFFSEQTFHWLGKQWQVEAVFQGADVVLFTKNY
ncbi:MAG: class I SAM-dependent methyltransferase [Gammaproteobacteria bacterium]|nr:class I SAM-dependent methyltransferase [Gammaproteobacteria bacterium]MBQ0838630.1 class I SAM-dependent methyltransferase [Gammaproteobacteria bacterium]